MGMQHEPTADMGDFAVETRRESFYLTCPRVVAYSDGYIEIEYADIPKMRAALDQAEQSRRDRR